MASTTGKGRESHYLVKEVKCSNCGEHSTDLTIPMGKPVREFPCPNCGCKDTLYRVDPQSGEQAF